MTLLGKADGGTMERIMLSFDGSPSSLVALEWVAARAAQRGSHVDIAVVGGGLTVSDFGTDAALIRAERRLFEVAPHSPVTSVRLSWRLPGVLYDRTRHADLLVVGARRARRVWAAVAGRPRPWPGSQCRIPVVIIPETWEPSPGAVIVGLDDDDSSAAALGFAAAEAARSSRPLTVVHAWQMPSPRVEGAVTLLASPLRIRAEHRAILGRAGERASDVAPGILVHDVLVQENPATALVDRCDSASMLVLGTHHHGLLSGAMMGSVGLDVLKQTTIPVCIVPQSLATDHIPLRTRWLVAG